MASPMSFNCKTLSIYGLLLEIIKQLQWGAQVAQWIKASAFGSGHDPRVPGSSAASGYREPASSSLSLCLPLCLLVISVCQVNK